MTRLMHTSRALVAAGLMATLVAGAPAAALAADEGRTGTGHTDLYMVLSDANEHTGTDDPANPDRGDGYGANIAFTVPTSINYVVSSDGTMTGPTNAYIENESVFATHVSSVQIAVEEGWNLVRDVRSSSGENDVDLLIGPSTDKLNGADYTSKSSVGSAAAWNMAVAASSGTDDQVALETSGHVARLSADITSNTKFGTIRWYVTPGQAK